jgi:gliding motility-associated-like protein
VALSGLPLTGTWTVTRTPGGATTTGTGASATISGIDPGTYTFTVTTEAGCTSIATGNVVINQQPTTTPTLIINNPAPLCYPATADLTADIVTSGSTDGLIFTYWTNSNATIPYETPATATEGAYYIKGTTSTGCFSIRPVTITIYQQPLAYAGPDQVLEYIFGTTLEANVPDIFETGKWSISSGTGEFDDDTNPEASVTGLSLGENTLLWTVTNGVCPPAKDSVMITVHNLIIPTLITPNLDGRNDYFVLKGIETLGKTELIVFDRRGAQVYLNRDYKNEWDGVDYNNNPLPDDTYFFILKPQNGKAIDGYIVIRR